MNALTPTDLRVALTHAAIGHIRLSRAHRTPRLNPVNPKRSLPPLRSNTTQVLVVPVIAGPNRSFPQRDAIKLQDLRLLASPVDVYNLSVREDKENSDDETQTRQ